MSVETDLYDALRAAATVTNLVPQARITPMKRVQDSDLPAITYERITSDPQQSINGDDTDLDSVRIRVSCWSMSYAQAAAIGDAVRPVVATLKAYFISDQDLYEDDTKVYRRAMDWYIWTA